MDYRSAVLENITLRAPQEAAIFIIPPKEFETPMSFQEQFELISMLLNYSVANGVTHTSRTLDLHHIVFVGLLLSTIAIAFYIVVKRG